MPSENNGQKHQCCVLMGESQIQCPNQAKFRIGINLWDNYTDACEEHVARVITLYKKPSVIRLSEDQGVS